MTMSDEHGGDLRKYSLVSGRPAEEIIDFSASINPLGPPPWLRGLISRQVENLIHYPDPRCTELIAAIASRYGVASGQIVVGNGSTEIIHVLPRAIQATRAVVPVPSYIDYAASCELAGLAVRAIRLDGADGFALDWQQIVAAIPGDEIVFLGQPNNPTGAMFDSGLLKGLAAEARRTVFVVDEAFADFVEGYASIAADLPENVIVLRSLTKFYAIPGLRLGFAVASAPIAERIRRLMPDWSVNSFAQAAGIAALADENYARDSRQYVRQHREELAKSLAGLGGFTVYPSSANYLLVRIDRPGLTARALAEKLLKEHGIAVRVCDNFQGLGDCHIRVAVRTNRENRLLTQALSAVIGGSGAPAIGKTRKTPAVMFQGTCSSAGKSLLAAAMCRIMLQDGYAVAPFKAQNMSLNSFVTIYGGEMGRAQVVQAQACRLQPDVRMNPILLKPNSDTGTQVIVRGKPVGNMNVQGYTEYKSRVWQTVADCYDSLAGEYDAIVLEGAGSPAEVNLKSHDIVNMRMARHAEGPVLLVGDIDRGGVYASFVGTMEVLDEWERRLIAGFVVNKFRGDQSLLAAAHAFVERFTGRPVLGVVPFLKDLRLPQEDSVDFKAGRCGQAAAPGRCVDIAVIDLPHISNFTDFDALAVEPDVNLRIVRAADQLGNPQAVILPGSKSVISDLDHLRQSGLADAIAALARAEKSQIVGICGGYQMLGRTICDPLAVESSAGATAGLDMLEVRTVMAEGKTLMPAGAKHGPSGLAVRGYEIHHGLTDCAGLPAAFIRDDGQVIGVSTADGRIWGTYLHGVFDADEFRRHFVDQLRVSSGLPTLGAVQVRYDIEPELDRLADAVRTALPIDRIYKMMGLK